MTFNELGVDFFGSVLTEFVRIERTAGEAEDELKN